MKFFGRHKNAEFFHQKFNLKNDGTWKMANNFALLCSHHLVPSTSICLHVSHKRNINFDYEVSRVKHDAFRKFSAQNIFISKRNDEIFHMNYLEMKLTQTKIKHITVYQLTYITVEGHCYFCFPYNFLLSINSL